LDKKLFSFEWIETLPDLEEAARVLGQAEIMGETCQLLGPG
jgi:hypothetical protein